MRIIKTGLKLLAIVVALALIIPVGYYPLEKTDIALEGVEINKNYKPGTIGAYVVNLDRSPDRLQVVMPAARNLGIPVKRYSAVDGSKLSDEFINNTVNFEQHMKYVNSHPKKGTIGCTMSHIGIWREFLESDYEYALVIEDDARFDGEAVKNILKDLVTKSQLWDVVTFYPSYDGMPMTVAELSTGHHLSVYLFEIGSTVMYLLNRKAATSYLEKSLPMVMSIDHMYRRNWEFDLKFVGIENPRVVKHPDDQSVIGKTQGSKAGSHSVLQRAYRGIYKLQTYVAKFVYNLKLYLQLKESPA